MAEEKVWYCGPTTKVRVLYYGGTNWGLQDKSDFNQPLMIKQNGIYLETKLFSEPYSCGLRYEYKPWLISCTDFETTLHFDTKTGKTTVLDGYVDFDYLPQFLTITLVQCETF